MSILHRMFSWTMWAHPITHRLARAAPAVWLAAAIGLPAQHYASYSPLYPDVIKQPVFYTLLVVPAVAAMAQGLHTRQLCTRCATTPHDAEPASYVRVAWWSWHRMTLASSPGIAFLPWHIFGTLPVVLDKIGMIVLLFNAAWMFQALQLHRAHRRTCPYCRPWDKDPDAPKEPAPDPTPPGKTVTV
jgi:hypothetical protein